MLSQLLRRIWGRAALMRLSEETFSNLTAGFYEAGFGRNEWMTAMRSMVDAFGGAGGVVFDLNPSTGQISNWIGPGLEAGKDSYAEEANAINPRMHYSLKAPLGHIAWDYRFLSEPEIDRHDFYEWARRHGDVKYFMGTRLLDDLESGTSAFASVEFSPSRGHATKQMIEVFAQLRGHLCNAWRLNALLHRQRASETIEALLETSLACGVIVMDGSGRIRTVNERAGQILRLGDGLTLRDGLLVSRLATETRKLRQLTRACLLTASAGYGSHGGAVAVSRLSGLPRYIVRLMPIAAAPGPRPADLPAVVVTIADPIAPIDVAPDSLSSLYGLTRREAELAVKLSGGLSLRDAAAASHMSYNTARNHLRLLFEKTGAKSQLQLVSVLRGLNSLH